MTDLDSPRRNNDCYFYYYSTCAKGDSCSFRHEPSALGCETMCSFWKEGKCLNVHCNFRHMELRKNRKAIQCYWETQPGGCLKPHCPFMHQNVKQSNYGDSRIGPNIDCVQTVKPNDTVQASEKNYKSSVDSLVVNFEEESDTESAPSPIKIKKANVKTLEEIKLERIQEESAAYFSFHESSHPSSACEAENDLRHRLLHKMKRKRLIEENLQTTIPKRKKLNFIENASLDDHIKIFSEKDKAVYTEKNLIDEHILQKKKLKCGISVKENQGINTIKIKTLAEIRAERLKRKETVELDTQSDQTNMETSIWSTESENEVSSTSKDEIESRELHKVQSQVSPVELHDSSILISNTSVANSDITIGTNDKIEQNKMAIHSESTANFEGDIDELRGCASKTQSSLIGEEIKNTLNREEDNEPSSRVENTGDSSNMDLIDSPMEVRESENISDESDLLPNKLAEEVLLLDDDEDYANVNFKADDDLLDEIDDILGN